MEAHKGINPSNNSEDKKLEDVIKSIKEIIEKQNPDDYIQTEDYEEAILELKNTDMVEEGQREEIVDTGLISEAVKDKSATILQDFTRKIATDLYSNEEKSIDNVITNLIKPLLKEWLDSNLPRLVEKIVSEEIKRLIPQR